MAAERLRVTVVCARPDSQAVVALEVEPGTSVREAVERSGVLAADAALDVNRCAFGIFGRQVTPEQALREGDRVEVLRPLTHEPRARRRELARQGRTMGRKS
jgi:uncharacterized protein